MIKITKKQNKILIILGIIVLTFVVFISFIYLPAQKELSRLKQQYGAMEAEINNFKKQIGEDKPLERTILDLKNRFEILEGKFPQKEETVFKELSAFADSHGMEILSLTPEKKRTAIEMGNVAGYTVEELHISLTSRAPYKTAGEFFRALREEFPIYARVNQVNFGKESEKGTGMLTVDFDVDTYLLVPAGAAK